MIFICMEEYSWVRQCGAVMCNVTRRLVAWYFIGGSAVRFSFGPLPPVPLTNCVGPARPVMALQSPLARPLVTQFQRLLRTTNAGKYFFDNLATPETLRSVLQQVLLPCLSVPWFLPVRSSRANSSVDMGIHRVGTHCRGAHADLFVVAALLRGLMRPTSTAYHGVSQRGSE